MIRFTMTLMALAMLVAGSGCYYDEWRNAQAALRRQTEAREQAQLELLDAQQMNKQKDTQIEALQNQLETKDRNITNLEAQVQGLKQALDQAHGIATAMAEKQIGGLTIINRQLPPEVDTALNKLMEQYPDLLEKIGNSIRWKSDLLFPLGSDQMTASDRVQEALRKFAEIVKSPAAQDLELIIVGHTDTTRIAKPETLKEHKTNWHLSAHRAIAIMRLLSNLGVAEMRMGVMGYGELRPIADNSSEQGKSRNRRVEIYLVPKGSITGTGSAGVYNSDQAGPFVKPAEVGGTAPREPGTPARTPGARGPATRPPRTPAPALAPAVPSSETETPSER